MKGEHKYGKGKTKTPAKIKKELDVLFSKYIRARDPICVKCLRGQPTQCAHIFGRGKISTRWDENNALGLCFYCHLYWAHREPVEFTLWVQERMGAKQFAALKKKANTPYDSSNLRTDAEKLKQSLTSPS
jgi:hypothetical protein